MGDNTRSYPLCLNYRKFFHTDHSQLKSIKIMNFRGVYHISIRHDFCVFLIVQKVRYKQHIFSDPDDTNNIYPMIQTTSLH